MTEETNVSYITFSNLSAYAVSTTKYIIARRSTEKQAELLLAVDTAKLATDHLKLIASLAIKQLNHDHENLFRVTGEATEVIHGSTQKLEASAARLLEITRCLTVAYKNLEELENSAFEFNRSKS